jgi:hypothetical protein
MKFKLRRTAQNQLILEKIKIEWKSKESLP